MSEIELQRIRAKRTRRFAWVIQFISLTILLFAGYLASNNISINIGLLTILIILSVIGLISGCILQNATRVLNVV